MLVGCHSEVLGEWRLRVKNSLSTNCQLFRKQVAVFIPQKNLLFVKIQLTLWENAMSLAQPTLEDIWKLFQETDRKFQETDKKIKQVTENIGRLSNKLGDFIEEMVHPAAVRLFQERGIDVHEVHRNVSSTRHGEGIEVDLLVVNDTDIIA